MPKPGEWQQNKVERPKNDNEYLERMSRVIFMSGLNWKTLENKWPGIKKAFADFDVDKVADFDEPEIEKLMQNSDVIRNRPKISAVVSNAQKLRDISKQNSGFDKYLASLRAQGEDAMREEIAKNFAFMGKGTTVIFLYSVGEELPNASKEWQARHKA
jgi:DNA-3-methyladenine glycosylase I